ncbi:hypothetical protein RR46_12361 [Papilio xuthus]|uniref:Uncharacterized protein n=1 Tax=Papilio xuthus TaxID=66420 RepID=A0A194PSB8_PAPXU|nr:hypothetical protein RR46_12361 [Papilio xuthus]
MPLITHPEEESTGSETSLYLDQKRGPEVVCTRLRGARGSRHFAIASRARLTSPSADTTTPTSRPSAILRPQKRPPDNPTTD